MLVITACNDFCLRSTRLIVHKKPVFGYTFITEQGCNGVIGNKDMDASKQWDSGREDVINLAVDLAVEYQNHVQKRLTVW